MVRCRLLRLAAISCALAPAAAAEWSQLNGPDAPIAQALVTDGDVHLLGTNEADAGDIFKSTDGGRNWVNVGFPNPGILSMIHAGGIFYAATYGMGVLRSADGGETWTPHVTGLEGLSVEDVVAHDGALFAAPGLSPPDHVHRSDDGGDTWTPLAGSPSSLYLDLHATTTRLLAGTQFDGLHLSLDGGTTWTPVTAGLPSDPGLFIEAIAGDDAVLHAAVRVSPDASQTGIYRSVDGGTSWTKISTNLSGFANVPFTDLIADGPELVVSRYSPSTGGGVFRSIDGGVTWSVVSGGIGDAVRALLVARDGDDLLCGTDDGLFRSEDDGVTWSYSGQGTSGIRGSSALVSDGPFLHTGVVFASVGVGAPRTDDLGATWIPAGPSFPMNTYPNDYLVRGGEILAALYGLERGVHRTSDHGATWVETSAGLPPQAILQDLHPHGGEVFAGAHEGVFRSPDGADWEAVLPGVSVTTLATLGDDLFAGARNTGVFRSTDGGDTWSPAGTGLEGLHVTRVAPGAGTLLATTIGQGIFRLDAGTWVPTGLDDGFVNDVIEVGGVLVTARYPEGPLTSTDGGATWSSFDEGFAGESIDHFIVHDGLLVAGTSHRGVWVRPLAELPGVVDVAETLSPAPAALEWRVSPNPFRTRTSIRLDTRAGGSLSTRLFDVNGRLVHATAPRRLPPGGHRVGLAVPGLTPGVYFVSVELDGTPLGHRRVVAIH